MLDDLATKAGAAVAWRGVQLVTTRVLSLLQLLILARLLVPEDFGLFAIGLTAVQTIMLITDFGMVPALIQHPNPTGSHYDAAWTLIVSRGLLISVGIILAAPLIAFLYKEPEATPIIRALALKPLLEAFASIKVAQLARRLQFQSLAVIGIVQVFIEAIVSIVLANTLGVWAMVAGVLSGGLAFIIASYLLAPYRPHLFFTQEFVRPLILYGRWIFVTGVVAVTGSFFLEIVISRQFGATGLGLYFLSRKLGFLLVEIGIEVIGAVAFPVYARLQDHIEQITNTFQAVFTSTYLFITPAYALLIVLAPVLEEVVLGEKWVGTAPVVRILSIVGLIGLFTDALVVPLLKGVGQPQKVAILELVQSTLLIAFSWPLATQFGLPGAASAWIPAVIASLIVGARFVMRILNQPYVGLGKSLVVIFAVSFLGATIALIFTNFISGLVGLIIAIIAAYILMSSGLLAMDRFLTLGLWLNLTRVFPQVKLLAKFVPVGW